MAAFEEDLDPRFVKRKRRGPFGCFGWILVMTGVFLLTVGTMWYALVDWLVLALGLYFIYYGTRNSEKGHYFPGILLLILSSALLARKFGWIDFQDWQFWSWLLLGLGFGSLTLWITNIAGRWILLLGGLFLLAAGLGFGNSSFWTFQHQLRNILNLWPLLIMLIGILLLFRRWKKGKQSNLTQ